MKRVVLSIVLLATLFALGACTETPQAAEYFRVTFGGNYIEEFSLTVKDGECAIKPETPVSEGRKFLYWAKEDGSEYDFGKPVRNNIKLHAQWEEEGEPIKYYTVNFYGVDGKLIASQKVAEGAAAINPAVAVSDFFIFDGWDIEFDKVTSDLEVHACERYDNADEELFSYGLGSDLTYIIKGLKGELPETSGYVKLALPATYKGIPVTAIADGKDGKGVFTGKNILSLYVPASYKRIGSYAFYGNPALTSVTFNEGLKEIGEGAFMATRVENALQGNYAHSGSEAFVSALCSVELPASLETIGDYAFDHIGGALNNGVYSNRKVTLSIKNNSRLSSIGKHAFEGVFIDNIDLSSTTKSLKIDDYAFAGDTYLNWVYLDSYEYPRSTTTSLSLPASIFQIGKYAFYGLGNMSSYYNGACTVSASDVNFYSDGMMKLSALGEYAFYGARLKGSLNLRTNSVGAYAFYGQMLSKISLDRVTEVGEYAFARSSGSVNSEVDLGSSLVTLKEGAFCSNLGLTRVTIPSTLQTIDALAFSGCADLEGNITLPESVTSLGMGAFASSGIKNLTINGEVSIGRQCFENSSLVSITGKIKELGIAAFSGCTKLTTITLPQEMTELPESLFSGCSSLAEIELPSELTSISRAALSGCSSLKTISLPANIITIGIGAFEKCSSLQSVDFSGESVTSIESYAFAFCMSLKQIDLPDSVKSIGNYAFQGAGLTTFTTPASLKTMGWRVFYKESFVFATGSGSSRPQFDGSGLIPDYGGSSTKISLPKIETLTISSETDLIDFSEQGTFDGAEVIKFKVGDGNSYYSANNGSLYDKDGNVLIMYKRDDAISYVSIPEGTTEISTGAFYNNQQITSVTLPNSLTKIGDLAFYGCVKLSSITIPSSVTSIGRQAFAGQSGNMSGLSRITFDDDSQIKTIGQGAFEFNKSLRAIEIPASLTEIGNSAFYSASALIQLDLSEASSLTKIGDLAFSGENGLAPKLTELDFSNCTALSGTGRSAFAKCSSLQTIDFGSLTTIDAGSFDSCVSLVTLEIGSNITDIGSSAFHACTSIKDIVLPESSKLKKIEYYAFSGAIGNNMTFIELDLTNAKELESIGDYAFAYGNVSEVKLPNSPFKLGDDVFNSCSSLTKVDFGGVKSIGENVFRGCISLTSIVLPQSLELIDKDAFRETNLTSVEIHSTDKLRIGMSAFFGCTSLATVNIYGDKPVLIGDINNYAFYSGSGIISGLTIYVDKGQLSSYVVSGYDVTGWGVYRNIIKERS